MASEFERAIGEKLRAAGVRPVPFAAVRADLQAAADAAAAEFEGARAIASRGPIEVIEFRPFNRAGAYLARLEVRAGLVRPGRRRRWAIEGALCRLLVAIGPAELWRYDFRTFEIPAPAPAFDLRPALVVLEASADVRRWFFGVRRDHGWMPARRWQ